MVYKNVSISLCEASELQVTLAKWRNGFQTCYEVLENLMLFTAERAEMTALEWSGVKSAICSSILPVSDGDYLFGERRSSYKALTALLWTDRSEIGDSAV